MKGHYPDASSSHSASPRLRGFIFLTSALIGFTVLLASARAHPANPRAGQLDPKPGEGSRSLARDYEAAAARYGVPRDLLLAIGYANTRWQPLEGRSSRDHGYGPMHLTVPPGGDSLLRAARLLDLPLVTLLGARRLGASHEAARREGAFGPLRLRAHVVDALGLLRVAADHPSIAVSGNERRQELQDRHVHGLIWPRCA